MRLQRVVLSAFFLGLGVLAVRARPAAADPDPDPPPITSPPELPGVSPGAKGEVDTDDDAHPHVEPTKPKPATFTLTRIKLSEREGMLLVPGGRFAMGTNMPKAPLNERPPRTVVVAPYWLDRTEVTVSAYRACVEHNHCERPRKSSASCTFDLGDGALPVSCVRWADADAYCQSVQKRLPTEIEWEFAARGSSGYMYPWGNRFSDCKLANTLIRDNSGRPCASHPSRVGSTQSNASVFGFLDMAGNVQEWTGDWYTETLSDLAPRAGASHTLRGGGWLSSPSRSRTTTRDWGSALEAGPNVGFRCARDASTPPGASKPKPRDR